MHMKLEELNRGYADLVKKYKDIHRERSDLQMTVDDLVRANRLMEQDFTALSNQISQYKDHKDTLQLRMTERLHT